MDFYQVQGIWRAWQTGQPAAEGFHLADDIAAAFTAAFYMKEPEDLRLVDLLCEMATAGEAVIAQAASVSLFSKIIETLSDDFSESGAAACSRVLLRILAFVRKQPEGRELDLLLKQKGFTQTSELLSRFEKICEKRVLSDRQREKVQKIIILSRVTVGADIAITRIIIQRLRNSFPHTELVLIGPGHLSDMFAEMPRCRCVPFIYKNDGTLVEKMTSWPSLLATVTQESKDCAADEILLFDTDTRLSQLGLLPLSHDDNTWYFPSRTIGYADVRQKSLYDLSNQWMNTILRENKPTSFSPLFSHIEEAYSSLRRRLKKNRAAFIITINFGVGNDPQKKIDAAFELTLLRELLKTPQTVVILDSGCGEEERQRTEEHLRVLKLSGTTAQTIAQGEKIKKISLSHGILSHQGPLGDLGKLIRISDCFIGYDSCGQHIATAAGTPSVIIFAGAPSARFVARWSPNNPAGATIPLYRNSELGDRERAGLLKKVTEAVAQVREKAGA
jgi:ADP-heptose:LPS heptosyltransferase